MGVFTGIGKDVRFLRDIHQCRKAGRILPITDFRAIKIRAENLKIAYILGKGIMNRFNLPRFYYEKGDMKRTWERIAKSFVMDEKSNPFILRGGKLDWKGKVTAETKEATSLGEEIFIAMRHWLPDYIFTMRKPDGAVNSEYYINILNEEPKLLSTTRVFSPRNKLRAISSLSGFAFRKGLFEELRKLNPKGYSTFKKTPVLGKGLKIFVSDIHMGGGGRPDDFEVNKEAFIRFLGEAKSMVLKAKSQGIPAYFILIGDVLELWQFDMDEIFARHRDVIEKIIDLGVEVYYIYGNHDMDVAEFENYTVEWPNGTKLHITEKVFDKDGGVSAHGHQADPLNSAVKKRNKVIKDGYDYSGVLDSKKESNPIGKTVTKAVKFLEYLHPDMDEWLNALRKRLTPRSILYREKPKRFCDVILGFKQEFQNAEIGDAEYWEAIFGHTHTPDKGNKTLIGKFISKLDEIVNYFNVGAWVKKGKGYFGIKNAKGEVNIVKFGEDPEIDPFAT